MYRSYDGRQEQVYPSRRISRPMEGWIGSERDRVIEAVTRLFLATDRRDWSAVRESFGDGVFFGMSSLSGAAPAIVTPGRIIAGGTKGLRTLAAIHHQTGNVITEIDRDGASLFCCGIAIHYLPDASGRNTRTFVGSYEFGLKNATGRAWLIDSMVHRSKFIDGNRDLESSGAPGSEGDGHAGG
jgi:hypothetical protein